MWTMSTFGRNCSVSETWFHKTTAYIVDRCPCIVGSLKVELAVLGVRLTVTREPKMEILGSLFSKGFGIKQPPTPFCDHPPRGNYPSPVLSKKSSFFPLFQGHSLHYGFSTREAFKLSRRSRRP